MTTLTSIVALLSDVELVDEIETVTAEVCCASYGAAAAALCGCRGAAGEYLDRLRDEAGHRQAASS